jgi:LmbE family N-acetylglucosaminyl deacetylase
MRSAARHIYLSPHLDDAILSCGGAMHGQVVAGDAVVVVNVFAGSPDYLEYSAYAERQHRKWGGREGSVAIRLAEDKAVLEQLGASIVNWDYPESIYRKGRDDRWLYASNPGIFGDVAEDDPSLAVLETSIREVAGDAANTMIYAPLAIGHHVDHQLVRTVAIELAQTIPNFCFYEDFPYVARESDALEKALAEVNNLRWEASLVPIDVNPKIAAIGGYHSQIVSLFGNLETMQRMVREYAQSLGDGGSYFERFWTALRN